MPPSKPATSAAGKANAPSEPAQKSATPPPVIAPTVNCPSAPMFHTFARNPMASPNAHSMRGVAFSNNSPTPYTDATGSTKNKYSASSGLRPSAANTIDR